MTIITKHEIIETFLMRNFAHFKKFKSYVKKVEINEKNNLIYILGQHLCGQGRY